MRFKFGAKVRTKVGVNGVVVGVEGNVNTVALDAVVEGKVPVLRYMDGDLIKGWT